MDSLERDVKGGTAAPDGFRAGGISCGIRKGVSKPDLAMIACGVPCDAAAVYTRNLVKGAPLGVTRENLSDGRAQAVLCNSGNANACCQDGPEKARRMGRAAARALKISPRDVIVASTGVIGVPLPIEPIEKAVPDLAASLSKDGSLLAAHAIMTTDTAVKNLAVEFPLGGKTVRIGGIAKGSGMIHPNMGTMLCFLTTDAAISSPALNAALRRAVDESFNMVSVDGDTSTNDMCVILADGLAGNPRIEKPSGEEFEIFSSALKRLCVRFARKIAKDGEGATRLLVCAVTGAGDRESARLAARAVVRSNLVKAAIGGSDANWGRVLCALGYSGARTDPSKADVSFSSKAGSVAVFKNGAGIPFREDLAKKILSEEEVTVRIALRDGDARAEAYGCDLTCGYVRINGSYRS